MREPMFQVYVVRDRDSALTGNALYRVMECFQVKVDFASQHYNGRRVYKCNWRNVDNTKRVTGCVLFSKMPQQKGTFISLRSALGIKKAGRV